MRSVTSSRVLPHWAIEELGQVSEKHGLKIIVQPLYRDWFQMLIKVYGNYGVFKLVVDMQEDWEDLRGWHEGDLWCIVEELIL